MHEVRAQVLRAGQPVVRDMQRDQVAKIRQLSGGGCMTCDLCGKPIEAGFSTHHICQAEWHRRFILGKCVKCKADCGPNGPGLKGILCDECRPDSVPHVGYGGGL